MWQQKGTDINGIAPSDIFGFSLSISADGNTIAAGAPDSNSNGFESGNVRVFQFEEGDWAQIGNDLIGEALSDHSGYAVSLSSDGNRVAIGAPDNGLDVGEGSNFGQVRVYEYQSDEWIQIGEDIDGENPEDNSGFSVSLNEDGSIVAIGAPNNSSAFMGAGQVRVYAFEANSWMQIGEDIDGLAQNDKFGSAVSLNHQGTTLAIGAVDHDGIGQVRVFEKQADNWVQIGADIDGEATGDDFGFSVDLNANGAILAVGAPKNSGFMLEAGHTKIYTYNSGSWQQIDTDIDGEALEDRSGNAVSLSADGSIVAIAAYLNDDNGFNTGHARLFYNDNVLANATSLEKPKIVAYPNPVTNIIHLTLEEWIPKLKVTLYTIQDQLIYTKEEYSTRHVMIDMASFAIGTYILKVELNGTEEHLRIIKQ